MTAFSKTGFSGTEVVTYGGRFVARFKRGGRADFIRFLVKNFTVEEYFSSLDSGIAPLTTLQGKGYIQPHIKTLLRDSGYQVSLTGFRQYITDCTAARQA